MTIQRGVMWAIAIMIFVGGLHADQQPVAAQDEKTWLINQINNLRANAGIHAYVWNGQLAAAAQQHSDYMAATGHVSHQQTNGSMPADRAAANGYSGGWGIENIYGGGLATANDAWNFWVNSSVHYSGLVNQNTNEIGIGVGSGAYGQYYTLVFGKGNINPPPAQPVNNSDPAPAAANAPTGASNGGAPAAATRRPLPTRTFTPSATVPTFTPSVTWTFTPIWTQSVTPTLLPATSTAISLPTVVAIALPTEIPPSPSPIISPSATFSLEANQEPVTLASIKDEANLFSQLLPYLIIGQIAFIGLGLGSMLMRRKR